jgi:GntR family transcriptional repressor for pyruvate dehydrogenase complex
MPVFDPIRRRKVFEEVAGTLHTWILAELKPGDRLPSERELMAMFGVGRSSVRDALQKLQLEGLLETRHGVGSIVAEPVRRTAIVPLTSVLRGPDAVLGELMDFRRIIEPPLAARAAARASAEELATLDGILRRQAEKVRRNQPAVEEDTQFHYAIALAARNSVVVKILDTLMSLLRVTREQDLQPEERSRKSLQGHRRILAAIQAGDSAGAAAAMELHLDEVEALITPDQRKHRHASGAGGRTFHS